MWLSSYLGIPPATTSTAIVAGKSCVCVSFVCAYLSILLFCLFVFLFVYSYCLFGWLVVSFFVCSFIDPNCLLID